MQRLIIFLQQRLFAGFHLDAGINAMRCKQADVFLIRVVRQRLGSRLQVEQAALFRFRDPAFVVAVAVEQNALQCRA